jgi:hypothetical protein
MRDTSEGMIEIIDAVKSEDGCFAFIAVPKKAQRRTFRFEITSAAYKAVRKILESRPLDIMPGLKYRYFWNGSMGGKTEQKISLGIRCEVGRDGKNINYEVPHNFAENLKWFNEIETFDEAEHLSIKT